MSVSEIISLSIAIISLIISIYVVVRDQTQKRFDLIMTMYDRLESANAELQIYTDKKSSQNAKWKLGRELETACYMLYRKKIDREIFYHLYNKWLLSRSMFWTEKYNNDMSGPGNHPYTVWAIKKGFEEGMLNNSKEKQKFLKQMNDYIISKKLGEKYIETNLNSK